MVAAFFLIFLPALRELTTSVLLYGPKTRTIGVAIYTLNEDGETVYAAALASVALVIIVIANWSSSGSLGRSWRRIIVSYVKLEHVTKRFGKVTAVSDLNIDIEQGECFPCWGLRAAARPLR